LGCVISIFVVRETRSNTLTSSTVSIN
jgi:hypothetical protein